MHPKTQKPQPLPPPQNNTNPPSLDNIEHIENYRPGGFHPVHLHDTLADNRHHILHKLGHGGFPTVWLARDRARDQLVARKILTAEASASCPEVEILPCP